MTPQQHRRRACSLLACLLLASSRASASTQAPLDEAKAHGLTVKDFEAQDYDYFPALDWLVEPPPGGKLWPDALLDKAPSADAAAAAAGAPSLSGSERKGRNTWMLWCGGNERFWDWLASDSYGFMDLLKLLDSRQRGTRWRRGGLVNEPDMVQASEPDAFGLWLDRALGRQLEWEQNPEFVRRYGRSSGVIGLRLFLNPEFEARRDEWDAARYYDPADTEYWQSRDLVRPYRVGMSCAFCHASAHPLNPPADPEAPRWENLSASIGSQYLRMRAVFGNLLTPDNFIYHVLDSQPPGTIDTSLIASDMLNNTNTMNAIFGVPQRVRRSLDNPFEKLSGASASLPILGDFTVGGREIVESTPYLNPRPVPRVLFDGADSIGVYGALARVYLNIGTYSEQWLRLHNPLLGGVPQEPFTIADCQQNSVYWQATQARVDFLRDYFLRITPTMPLRKAALTSAERARGVGAIDAARLAQGRAAFARNCSVCHSSLQPESVLDGLDLDRDGTEDLPFLDAADLAAAKAFQGRHGPVAARRKARQEQWTARGELWDHDPGQWLVDGEYLAWATTVVEEPWFWRHNFLSSDFRVPVNYVQTNSARALATNAMAGNMWADFSSDSFKALPSIGPIPYFDPYLPGADGTLGAESTFTPRHRVADGAPAGGGGPGFYRPAPLMSVWATAPYLHNNSLGLFNNDPSVGGRMSAFQDGIEKLLWPEKRLQSSSYNEATPERLRADHGLIWRTPCETKLSLPGPQIATAFARLPSLIAGMMKDPPAALAWLVAYPWVPSVALLIAAFLLLRRFADDERGRRRRRWGVALIVFALPTGVVLFFLSGRLGDLHVGPIPKGTPVSLLANLNLEDRETAFEALKTTIGALAEIRAKHLEGAEADAVLRTKVAPALMAASKCPDLVMDRGHDFPWFKGMSDEDKRCLIELLKTL